MKLTGTFFLACMLLAVSFTVETHAADATNGATLYAQSCAACHGSSGEGGIGPSHIGCSICDSLQSLIDEIEDEMPTSDPTTCTGTCAEDTAAYIYEVFNGYTIGAPEACTPISPSGQVTEENPTFEWSVVNIATWYKIWIGNGNHRIYRQWYESTECTGTDTCGITLDYSLPDGDWTWMVKTWNEDGAGDWSDSLSISVSTGITLPSAATLVSPNGTTVNFVTFAWNAVSDATYYYLWVDDENGANQIKQWYTAAEAGCDGGEAQCSLTTTVSLDAGSYTWYIQTWNDVGFGSWSSGTDFSVAE